MLHGPQQGVFDLTFRVPSECARMVAAGEADIGIVPSIELRDRNLDRISGVGIACRGPVRSILLVSKCPAGAIATLAADASSRTSVALTRIVLAERYGVEPVILTEPPDLAAMLERADAALIIGDPALHLNPATLPFHVYDLGREWTEMTGLPMVFAMWAGRAEHLTAEVGTAFRESCRFGLKHLDDIVQSESAARGLSAGLARQYLTSHIVYEIGAQEEAGLERFLRYARDEERAFDSYRAV